MGPQYNRIREVGDSHSTPFKRNFVLETFFSTCSCMDQDHYAFVAHSHSNHVFNLNTYLLVILQRKPIQIIHYKNYPYQNLNKLIKLYHKIFSSSIVEFDPIVC